MGRRATVRSVLGGIVVLVLVAAGCSSSGANSGVSTPPTTRPTPTSSLPDVQTISTAEGQVLVGTATGNSPCEKAAPTPASPGELGNGTGGSSAVASKADVAASEHGPRGMVKQMPLTEAQRDELRAQMTQAGEAAAQYPTVASAEAAGYSESTVYVPCIGAHFTNVSLASHFDPRHPSELLYDGTTPGAKIVGLSYLVYHHNGPPPGFAGPNDHWHQHNANGGLCMRGSMVVGSEATSRARCAAIGGHKTLLIDIWMLHAWVVPGWECSWGVFSGECPELGGRIGGTAFDPPAPS